MKKRDLALNLVLIAIGIIASAWLFIFVLGFFNFIDDIDYHCNTDSDCEVKNVGNQCGMYQICVNKNFQPNPPELQSMACGGGMISTSKCECVKNRCEEYRITRAEN